MSSPPPSKKSSPPTPRRRAFDAIVSTGGGTTPLAPIAHARDVQQRERSGSDPSNPPAHWPDLSSSESTTRMPRRKPRRLTTAGRPTSGAARPAGAAAGGLRRAGSSAAAAAGGLRRSGSNESVTSAHSTGHSLQFLRSNDEWDDDDSSKAAPLSDVSDVARNSSSSSTNSKVMDLRPSSSAVAGMDESSLFSLNHLNLAAAPPDIVTSHDEMSVASGHSGYFSAYLAGILAKPDAADDHSVDASTITASTPCPLAVQRKRRRMYIRRCARAMITFVALAALSGTTIYLIVEEEPLWEAWFSGQDQETDRDYRRLPQGAPRIPPGVDHFENELMAAFGDAPQHLHANRDRERVRKAMAHGPRLEHRNFPASLHEHPQRQRYLRSSNGTIAGGKEVAVDEADARRDHSVDEYYENAAGRDGYRSVTQKDHDMQGETASAWS